MDNHLPRKFAEIVGQDNVLTDEADRHAYAYDAAVLPPELPSLVVRPETTEALGRVVATCNELGLPLTIRGSGTNLSGGTIPSPDGVVALTGALDTILEINEADMKQFLPAYASLHNPIDVVGDAPAERYRDTLMAVVDDPQVHAILILLTPTASAQIMERETKAVEPLRLTDVLSRSDTIPRLLAAGEVAVWRLHCPPSLPLPAAAVGLLDDAERSRAARFLRETDRRLFTFSHAMALCGSPLRGKKHNPKQKRAKR